MEIEDPSNSRKHGETRTVSLQVHWHVDILLSDRGAQKISMKWYSGCDIPTLGPLQFVRLLNFYSLSQAKVFFSSLQMQLSVSGGRRPGPLPEVCCLLRRIRSTITPVISRDSSSVCAANTDLFTALRRRITFSLQHLSDNLSRILDSVSTPATPICTITSMRDAFWVS
jgi:hypothetical protein